MRAIFAVITTYERPAMALECIHSLNGGADMVFVIDNGTNDPMPKPSDTTTLTPYYVIRDSTQPVNLSQLWNLGIAACAEEAQRAGFEDWYVAILNDDALASSAWMETVADAIADSGAAAGCAGPYDGLFTSTPPSNLSERMTGWAFMLRGPDGLLADEQFHWWFGDDDLDWRARGQGGMRMINTVQVPANRLPNGHMTGERQERAALDAAAFERKWGRRAW